MEVSITRFRRELFELVGRAMAGHEVWVAHKGRRFRVSPEEGCGTRLSRITPLEVVAAEASAPGDGVPGDLSMQEEMTRAWESDWSTL